MSPERVGPAADYSRQSNLALAFLCLPPGKRADMNVFYTFCRVVDDIADSGQFTPEQKQEQFDAWRRELSAPAGAGGDGSDGGGEEVRLVGQTRALIARHRLPVEHFLEIIAGCEMDVRPREYATFEDLRAYCYRVASVVGLVSIEIFGYRPEHAEACRRYAVDLGLALQWTNIIRDVARDAALDGRVYLPAEDLTRFGLTAEVLRRGAPREAAARGVWETETGGRVRELLRFEAERAEGFYASAVRALPRGERRAMVAAEIMRAVYHRLLAKMRRDDFRVFATDYRLGKPSKLWIMAATALASRR